MFSLRLVLTLCVLCTVWAQDGIRASDFPEPIVTTKVFMDITMAGDPIGRIEIGLYGNLVPKTVSPQKGRHTDCARLKTFELCVPVEPLAQYCERRTNG